VEFVEEMRVIQDSTREDAPLPRRVVLLGASNLTRGISTVVETARAMWGHPLEILAALGHGRSYGQKSTVLIRQLPGIAECGLWEALASRPAASTAALVADIGNDLLYDVPVEVILQWVNRVLEDLKRAQSRTVLILPPLCNLHAVDTWRFHCLVKVLFPKYRLTPGVLTQRAQELEQGLRRLAQLHAVNLVAPRPEWYGLDPIHILSRQYVVAWSEILRYWNDPAPDSGRNLSRSWKRWIQMRSAMPDRYWLGGIERRNAQPARRFEDGSTLALY